MKNMMNISMRVTFSFCLLLLPYCASSPGEEERSPIVINEFMTKNTSTNTNQIVDEYGEADDWIELYNSADKPVSLKGLYLSDSPTHLRKYALFDTVLPPFGYVLIWADNQPDQGKHHTKFKLSATDGDQIILSNDRGGIIDSVQFLANSGNPEARLPDQSYGRSADGANSWCQQKSPTPLVKNSGCLSD